jgi:hypothetical protein
MRPAANEHDPYFSRYIDLVGHEEDILSAFGEQSSTMQKMLSALDETRALFRYEDGKWSVKEVVGHMIDTERIMSYRALAIARGEKQPLPGFDQDEYMQLANFDSWRLGDLAESYALVRRTNLVFFQNLPEEAWSRRGIASEKDVTVRALAWIIAGHERHHMKVLREKYRL